MIIYPKAKINLGLRVIEKREDGFHNLESLFVAVPDCIDILEIVESNKLSFSLYGASLDCEPGMNICEKAFKLLAQDFDIPGADIHLFKKIPSGAGLGGGSSDGACTLILINDLYNLGLDTSALQLYASRLGSDCPYFILAHQDTSDNYSPVIVTGKGDILEKYPLEILNNLKIKIVTPNIFISTAEAYTGIVPKHSSIQLKEILQMSPQKWKTTLFNDFEKHIFEKYPQLLHQKELLYQQGAIYASMTGSGSSLFGLFK